MARIELENGQGMTTRGSKGAEYDERMGSYEFFEPPVAIL
jgi:hypothetical protein